MRKSNEFFASAEDALAKGHWNAAVSNAIFSCISMADALATFYLGQRSKAQEHSESLALLGRISEIPRQELDSNARHLTGLLGMKSAAQYGEELLKETDAKTALKHAERFRKWAESKLPKG